MVSRGSICDRLTTVSTFCRFCWASTALSSFLLSNNAADAATVLSRTAFHPDAAGTGVPGVAGVPGAVGGPSGAGVPGVVGGAGYLPPSAALSSILRVAGVPGVAGDPPPRPPALQTPPSLTSAAVFLASCALTLINSASALFLARA